MNAQDPVEIKSYLDWALKGRSTWWLYLIGLVIFQIILSAGSSFFVILLVILVPALASGSVVGSVAMTTLGFLPAFLAIPFFTWLLHKRPWWSVALPQLKLDGWKLGIGFLFGVLINLVVYLAGGLFAGSQISFVAPDLSTYLPLLIVGAITIFIQVTAEELLYRGYTMQFMRRLTANPVLIVGISGLLFAAIHIGNVFLNGMPWYGVLIYLFDGLVYGWLAWRSRSLWMPIGFHLANNFALVVLVNEKANTDLLQGSPLIVVDKLPSFNFMLIASGIVYLLVVVIINWLISRREKNAAIQQVSY
jgi:membrane protease YdiL (CAAX protease family)